MKKVPRSWSPQITSSPTNKAQQTMQQFAQKETYLSTNHVSLAITKAIRITNCTIDSNIMTDTRYEGSLAIVSSKESGFIYRKMRRIVIRQFGRCIQKNARKRRKTKNKRKHVFLQKKKWRILGVLMHNNFTSIVVVWQNKTKVHVLLDNVFAGILPWSN